MRLMRLKTAQNIKWDQCSRCVCGSSCARFFSSALGGCCTIARRMQCGRWRPTRRCQLQHATIPVSSSSCAFQKRAVKWWLCSCSGCRESTNADTSAWPIRPKDGWIPPRRCWTLIVNFSFVCSNVHIPVAIQWRPCRNGGQVPIALAFLVSHSESL